MPDPKPAVGEVLLRVKAAALNHLDLFLRSGASTMPGFKLPHIGGFDVAGEIRAVGPGVDPKRVGEAVVVASRVTGPQATSKLDMIGTARPGGYAELVAAPVQCLAPKPTNYSWEEAAAFGCVYLTAYCGLTVKAAVKPGEVVLVHAGGSGAGSAAVQVAKAAGATVITTVGSDEKCVKAKELLRADYAVNYKTQDFREVVKDVTCGRGVDVVFDPVWGETAVKTLESLGFRSRWIVLGMVGGLKCLIDVSKLMFKEVSLLGLVEFYADEAQTAGAWAMAHRGIVRPIIAKTWPLAQLAEAQKQMERGDFFGKIVVVP
ncbi:MAG TPA: zinc-binding dehydrogenase [Phycisphaerae bacterium]|nr:zinc-binding dehydrogenase [Phycisphaerae bacterium]